MIEILKTSVKMVPICTLTNARSSVKTILREESARTILREESARTILREESAGVQEFARPAKVRQAESAGGRIGAAQREAVHGQNDTKKRRNMQERDFTQGNILKGMLAFSIPYLITCFLQTFYGMADLFIVGQFNGPAQVSAVSVGSQLMHMLTVVIAGFAMGSTVLIGRCVGAGDRRGVSDAARTTLAVFAALAAVLTAVLLLFSKQIIQILKVPEEAVPAAEAYMRICFAGVVFITAYNVVSAVFRGLGDTRRPMYYVAAAGIINVGLDWLLVGPFGMGAAGAAAATVASQGISVVIGLIALKKAHGEVLGKNGRINAEAGGRINAEAAGRINAEAAGRINAEAGGRINAEAAGKIIGTGLPIALQEGLIQVSFLVITMIANSRGVEVSAAVGIVEKVISFLFLVPGAMLSTVSALSAQNAGAGRHERSRTVLRYGCMICACFGTVIFVLCQPLAPRIVSLFVRQGDHIETVVRFGGQYLRTYSVDCIFAGIHFCFSGFFSAYGKSVYAFFHNIISILTIRIPGAWVAAVYFPATLYPMGLAAPLGSLLSVAICLVLYRAGGKTWGLDRAGCMESEKTTGN